MGEFVPVVVFAAIALIGVGLAAQGRSRSWRVAGALFAAGGFAFEPYYVAELAGRWPLGAYGTVADIAVWCATLGFFSLAGAMLVTLIALGAGGRRRFLLVFAATTLTIGVYQFWRL